MSSGGPTIAASPDRNCMTDSSDSLVGSALFALTAVTMTLPRELSHFKLEFP